MDLRDLVTDYEILVKQGLKLNQSYLEMIATYNELNFAPDFLTELYDSIIKIIDLMECDREILICKLTNLTKPIENISAELKDRSDLEQIQSISHDLPIMINFVKTIDLSDLRHLFINLTSSN